MSSTINLLAPSTSTNTTVKSHTSIQIITGVCISAVLITAGIYGVFWGLNWKLNNEISQVEVKLSTLAPVVRQEVNLDSVRTELEQIRTEINRLKAQKPKLSRHLDELLRITPSNVSLSYLEIKQQPFEVNIKGTAASQTEVAQFGYNLQKSEVFKDSIIQFSEKKGAEKVVTFNITISPKEEEGDKK